ncbi:MAG TPA: SDR family oxidoreductase [Noviherbaspirillum sp.]|uniref:SDR family oxidoreductase n=1 Tax=Noviherbaspirillum sp. TaxID=1926288 RepID=UPI002D4E4AE9|nr:SDR family oxidoreductase [Noviherbaspirillum sp.]HYD95874.1 SDR family oxidoreductase [Noviherbaspirillum sp.]
MRRAPEAGRRCAFITGAATGIGRAAARLFVKRGWMVGISDVDAPALARLAAELGPDNAFACRLDVADAQEWDAALASFFGKTGRLDVLVNNAGILISGPFESSPLSGHHALLDVNIKGMLNGCYVAQPYLAGTPGSRIINLSSASAIYGQASLATYSATKFAVRGLTEALNVEWQKHGIRVMDVMPLFVRTDMVRDMNAKSIKRLGVRLTAEDVAATIWKAAIHEGGFGKVHWPVGLRSKLLHGLSGLGPDRLSRYIAWRIAS